MKSVECREVFADFDPNAIVKINEKKIIGPGSPASTLLSDLKLRAVIENARQILKVDLSSTLGWLLKIPNFEHIDSKPCKILDIVHRFQCDAARVKTDHANSSPNRRGNWRI